MNIHPLVRIQYTRLLDPHFKTLFELKGGIKGDTEYPSTETINSRIEKYIGVWQPYEQKILEALRSITGLQFFQNTIDIYIIGRGPSFSFPMTISSHYEPDRFIDVLAHEMTHRLLTDNVEQWTPRELLQTKFSEETLLVRNHILVHATLKSLWLDALQEPARLARDEQLTQTNPPYNRAWEIVNERGYQELLQLIKK